MCVSSLTVHVTVTSNLLTLIRSLSGGYCSPVSTDHVTCLPTNRSLKAAILCLPDERPQWLQHVGMLFFFKCDKLKCFNWFEGTRGRRRGHPSSSLQVSYFIHPHVLGWGALELLFRCFSDSNTKVWRTWRPSNDHYLISSPAERNTLTSCFFTSFLSWTFVIWWRLTNKLEEIKRCFYHI